jgi:hypothetical protein
MISLQMRDIQNGVDTVGNGETKLISHRADFANDFKWTVILHEELLTVTFLFSQKIERVMRE